MYVHGDGKSKGMPFRFLLPVEDLADSSSGSREMR